ncbi:MAG: inositol monophosphatase family protein, partial [Sediminispirochaetaceae bacterium]
VQGLRRAGSVALDTSLVGEGVFDGYWELKVKLWDFAAGALIASEAGAKYAYRHIGGSNYNIVCANQALFPVLMEALAEVGDSFLMD